jgi:hypothetical protein
LSRAPSPWPGWPVGSASRIDERPVSLRRHGVDGVLPTPERHGETDDGHDRRGHRERPRQRVDPRPLRHEEELDVGVLLDGGDDLVVRLRARFDEVLDLVADVDRGRVARLEHALTGADRTGDALRDRVDAVVLAARPGVAQRADEQQRDGGAEHQQPCRPSLQRRRPHPPAACANCSRSCWTSALNASA